MKVKFTLDRNAPSSRKHDAVSKVIREVGNKATITGDVIVVEDGYDERRVVEILNREQVNYGRST